MNKTEFPLREYLTKRINRLQTMVSLTDVEGTWINNNRINEIEILQSALDKWEAEHKEEFCEWSCGYNEHLGIVYVSGCEKVFDAKPNDMKCHYCSKKIKEVEC